MGTPEISLRVVLGREIGHNVRELRQKKGYTIRDLAGIVGITDNAIWNIEVKGAMPDGDTMMFLALALGVSIESLYPHDYQERFALKPLEPSGRRALFPEAAPAEEVGGNARSSSEESNRSAVTPLKPGKSKAIKRKTAAQKDSPTRRLVRIAA